MPMNQEYKKYRALRNMPVAYAIFRVGENGRFLSITPTRHFPFIRLAAPMIASGRHGIPSANQNELYSEVAFQNKTFFIITAM